MRIYVELRESIEQFTRQMQVRHCKHMFVTQRMNVSKQASSVRV